MIFDCAASFDEDIFVDRPETAKAVSIAMCKAAHEYFGINEVSVIGSGEPLFMLVGGATSPGGDVCLQVSRGATVGTLLL